MSKPPVMESEDLIASLQRERDELAAECVRVGGAAEILARASQAMALERDDAISKWQQEKGAAHASINERDDAVAERDALKAENLALAARLREQPTVREIVGELREINHDLKNNWPANGRKRLAELLRRLEET